ncbi:MAG: GNAT family N-acetyltransferase [bacterium]
MPPVLDVTLREVRDSDLSHFFRHLQDPESLFLAAFTPRDPGDRDAFTAHWARIRASETGIVRTITSAGEVVGHVGSWEEDGHRELTYWIAREFWGRGIATAAVSAFLHVDRGRPFGARVAEGNAGSERVLEKCGFRRIGTDRGFANARGEDIGETIFRLD